MRIPVILVTSWLVGGCGETLDVGRNGLEPPEYAGPISPDVPEGAMVVGPTPVATHQYDAYAVAVDDSRVYWATGGGVVRSCTKADCVATVVTYATDALVMFGQPRPIAVHGERVYWSVVAAPSYQTLSIVACPANGCSGVPSVIASGMSPLGIQMVVDDQAVYWTTHYDPRILRCPVAGCDNAPVVLPEFDHPLLETNLTADDQNLYWSETPTPDSGVIWTIPKDGSAPARTLASNLHLPGAVAVDAERVYWAEEYFPGKIRSCPIAGCDGEPATLADEQQYPDRLVVGQAHAFWLTHESGVHDSGDVMECPLTGCGSSPTVLAANQPGPTDLAVDASFVFWTNLGEFVPAGYLSYYNDGSVYRVPIATP